MKQMVAAIFLAAILAITTIAGADVGPFSDAQVQLVKNAIMAEPSLSSAVQTADDQAIADWLNAAEPSGQKAWKTRLELGELLDILNWTAYIARSAAEKSALQFMFTTGSVNPSRANVRQGVADIFSGATQAAQNQRDAFLLVAQRPMSRVEVLCATGPDGGAYTMAFEGQVSPQYVSNILR